MTGWHVGVVVLAHGDEPVLEECVDAILGSTDVRVELIVVDNGCSSPHLDALEQRPEVRLLRPPRNLGFAGGCNLASAHTRAPYLALVNSDAVLHPAALARLCAVAARPSVGIASASVRVAYDPDLLNTAGNPVHFTGLTWSGAFGEPAAHHAREQEVASATGATMALRRAVWDDLGGFPEAYFAYLEDTELSLRCRQRGLRIRYVPDAVSVHHYSFNRNADKLRLLERNRLLLLLTVYETRTLLVLAPALLVFELAMLAGALRGGWGAQKVAGWWWVVRNLAWVRTRRRRVQEDRTVPDAGVLGILEGRITATNTAWPKGFGTLDTVLSVYWDLARRILVDRRVADA